MLLPLNLSNFQRGAMLGLALTIGAIESTLAHNIEVAEDVAATMHIEPNHNPRAGEPALTWFALTRAGGEPLPFAQCACQLAVYAEPTKPGDAPVLQPPLTAIDAEQHQDIPGAQVVFPRSGRYILALRGAPKAGVEFQPFELRYPVTVTAGTKPNHPPQVAEPRSTGASTANSAGDPVTEAAPAARSNWLPLAAIGGLGVAAVIGWRRHKSN